MFGNILDKVEDYVETKLEIAKIDIEEKISQIIYRVIQVLLLVFISGISVLFLTIGIAYFLNDVLQSPFAGFLIMSGFYFILFIILYLYKDRFFSGFPTLFKLKLPSK